MCDEVGLEIEAAVTVIGHYNWGQGQALCWPTVSLVLDASLDAQIMPTLII